jgi:hypothetical protein
MSNELATAEFPQMDWQQVALNGGPPCFYVEGPQYCGRAERWPGHGNPAFHDFVPLEYVTAKPMCPAHRKIEDSGDMNLEIGNDCVACSLNERSELLSILADGLSDTTEPVDSVTALMTLVNERDALLAEVGRLREALEKVRKRASDLMVESVYEGGDKADGIAVKFLMRLSLLAYEAKLEGYSMSNPFVAEAVAVLGETQIETEICPVCKDEVPADSMLSYNNIPNAFCQQCVDSGKV